MEMVVSAVAGDLINRLMSFLISKYKSEEQLEEKMKRLQDLLIRAHMIVEEAEVRYITNSKMLLQLKKLVEVMYQGYHVLDTIKYRTLCSSSADESEVSSSNINELSFTTCIEHLCTKHCTPNIHGLQITLDNLESTISNMKEFVLLLGGCERMFRRPYDSYVYIDNFMFGRHVEKQLVINILQQENIPPFAPAVLPIIGGSRVGKKTLVAHVCNNEKVRSKFSSILHVRGENIWRIAREVGPVRSLVMVEFTTDVDEEDWLKFYSSVKQMGRGSKIIIISRIAKLSRFGTVKPVRLDALSHEEYSYLFKVLAFGGTNPEEHPQLAVIAEDLAVALGGSLITANVCADMMRKNQNVHFWISLLKKYRNVVRKNFSLFGEHPKNLMDQDHPIDITRLASSSWSSPSSATLRLMPPHTEVDDSKTELPKVMFGDLITGSAILPREEFELIAWESRIPPYKRFVNFATYCDEEPISQHHTASAGKKRKLLDK
ncbi:hypothetical protein SETIT_9G292800v2 [Setaria italica]|uniref:Disease resistance N-terminal domain-containing protein n=1 Tax=Setaria italica TaxID=4555 RepID=K4AIN1_SETIT|nr:uncharacterized protein LOC101782536 [Setaria italica]RCV43418.1 hypothetical protein SETIT_9G292800v2 [Setaria italica]